ncbi:sporulation protein YunB [Clostridium sp. SHJSY1]|uniref:sporulation protein YunB n=1 Tax=Clostridium sp. SHJSY1 TaxID=2942483 RepID=UPI002874883B|nr:sporulation protein YunB [Clostridium sp. SHJSY1]MDS0526388.1 sporulation protein YunB [Clostridium sp. SHJSY1]
MKYYVKPRKRKINPYILVIITIFTMLIIFLYIFDERVLPSALVKSESTVRAKTIDTISSTSLELFNNEFKYDEMIIIDRDKDNNINLIRANTVKLNYLASELSIKCNEKLQEMGEVGIKVPLGWMTEQSAFYNLGPDVTVKIEPIGNMKVTYESKFESAGINQTRHKIYLNVEATVKTIIPLHSQEMEITCEIPVAETIIVGKIPNTAIDFNKGQ